LSVTWVGWVDEQVAGVRAAGRWRHIRTLEGGGPEFRLEDRRRVVSFASNDYLGLSQHPSVIAAGHDALDRYGAGTGSSRLIVGARPPHAQLEAGLAAWRQAEAALVFPSGFSANLSVLSVFGAGARIVSDERNHASIIDGARLARSEVTVYGHRDLDHAERLMAEAPGRVLVVSDTVFSMDGDVAPVDALSELCRRHRALLVLDDAHAVLDLPPVDPGLPCLRVGTLSKTLGSIGGFVSGPSAFVDLLINRARPWIFTTAPAPADMATAQAALAVVNSPEGEVLRHRLRAHIDLLRPGHPSPIVPVVVGPEDVALARSEALLARGLLVPAIRPPTVAPGTSRLRIALSAAHTTLQVQELVAALRR
jgi:8-amino-7-oxononanoate synthase